MSDKIVCATCGGDLTSIVTPEMKRKTFEVFQCKCHSDIAKVLAEATEELIHSYDTGSIKKAEKALAQYNEMRGEDG